MEASEKVRASFGGRDPLFGAGGKPPKLVELRLDLVQLNPDQPRKIFDEESIAELASSIEQHGLIQPVTVKRIPEKDVYLLVAGERRYRAIQKLGRKAIAAIITDGNADEITVIENLQREDLKPLEQADALARLMEKHGYNQVQLARVLGKRRIAINELLQIATLPEDIREGCRTSDTPKSVLIEIARAKEPKAQRALWERVKDGGTVRSVRATKKNAEVKDVPTLTTTAKALVAARGLLRRLEELEPGELTANSDQYRELMRVKAKIDELVQQKAGGTGA
jgi:ParB family chromosome partitioning protein